MSERSDIILADEVVTDPGRVRRMLTDRIRAELAGTRDGGLLGRRVVRLVVPIEPLDLFDWLADQTIWPRVYWEDRDGGLRVAAVGVADACVGGPEADYVTLRTQLDRVLAFSDEQVRYFGGFRFDRAAVPEERWASFGTYRFVLPRFEVEVQGSSVLLVCNLLLPVDGRRSEEVLDQVRRLRFRPRALTRELPLPTWRVDVPDEAGWRRNVEDVLAAFDGGELEKVVLARRAEFGFDEPLDPVLLLKQLRAATPACFHFCFQPEEGVAFVGASPERLFRRDGRHVRSEAVAGTRPRGATDRLDAQLLDELLGSEKELREHAYVRESIRDALRRLCDRLEIDEAPSEMRLATGRHLVSRVQGSLFDGVHGSEVMKALHPTPAVGGYPTREALASIRGLESFDRGWYAGPVGWIGTMGAEFAVAIRSGLIEGDRLSLFSGAGIVEGSDPQAEWQEIEQKIGHFTRVFGLDGAPRP